MEATIPKPAPHPGPADPRLAPATDPPAASDGAAADGAAVVGRLVDDVINGGDTALLRSLLAPEHVTHDPTGDLYGPEGLRIDIAAYRAGFSDLSMTTDELLTCGDRVVRRFTLQGTHDGPFMGVPPTGRRVAFSGIALHRLAAGRLVETWLAYDSLGLLRQLGVGDPFSGTLSAAAD
jgi:predicted ester cyclase